MTSAVSRRAAVAPLILAMAAPCALAQSLPEPSPQVIVTATRTPQRAVDVLSDTLVIDAEQIAKAGSGSVIDLLQRQRGIEVARNGGAGTLASVFIRGANSNQNIVLVDGVRIGSSTSGTANWSALPLSAIERIEIVYGPLSTLYGAGASGGVIQIFTKRGAGAPAVTGSVGYGSDNTRSAQVGVSGSTGGEHSISYALSAGKEMSRGFSATRPGNFSYNPDRDGYERESAAGRFALQVAKGHELGLVFLHSRLDAQFDSDASSYDARMLSKLDNVAIYSRNRILPNWDSLVQVAQARDKSGTFSATFPSQIDTLQTDFTWQNDFHIGADTLQLLYDHRKEEVEASSPSQLARERITNSFAAAYRLQRGAHQVDLAARRDRSVYGDRDTASAGYGYRFSNQLRASASYGTSFRAPNFNELYYPGYGLPTNQPERGRNAELGLHYNSGATQLDASYYHNRVTDLLVNAVPCPVNPTINTYGCAYNVNHALLEGVTLAASRQLGSWRINANADLQNPKDETTGKLLARRAKKHANLGLAYRAGALETGAELELAGERFDDAANRNRLGGYGLVNLYATWQLTPDWSLLARWNNVADKQYELARYYATPGSKLFASLRYGFR